VGKVAGPPGSERGCGLGAVESSLLEEKER
jgi:hypothetical protein